MAKAIEPRVVDPQWEERLPGHAKRQRREVAGVASFRGRKFADLTKPEERLLLRAVAIQLGLIEE